MATRSRTNLFLSYRDTAARESTYDNDTYINEGETHGLLNQMQGPFTSSSLSHLPPKWVDYSEEVNSILADTVPKIAQLDRLHQKRLLPGFNDRTMEESKINALTHEITVALRSTQKHIEQIAKISLDLVHRALPPNHSPAQAESRRVQLLILANVQTALATKVHEVNSEFRRKQGLYLQQMSGNSRTSGAARSSGEVYSNPITSPLSSGTNLSQQQQYLQQDQQQHSGLDLEQRHQEIVNIADSITELSTMFSDLSKLVVDQGTLLDRIDWNVEQMTTNLKGADAQLKQASRTQRRSGKCQLIFLLVLLIVGCIVVLIYRPHRSTPSQIGSTNPPLKLLF